MTKILSAKTLYEGYNKLCEYSLQPASLKPGHDLVAPMTREVLHCADSVVVLVYAPAIDSFVLCREFRTGVFFNGCGDDPYIFECVAGTIDPEILPEAVARREVREEAGLEVESIRLMTMAYASPGRITEKTYIYFAEVAGTPQEGIFGLEEEGEEIETRVIRADDAFAMMDEMKILDNATLLALSLYRWQRAQA